MYVFVLLFVFLLCFVVTPAVILLSWRIGAVDVPLDGRRMHRKSVPRGGGIAIFLSFFVGVALLNLWNVETGALVLGSGIMFLVGLADDVFGLGAWAKLFFQTVAALASVLASGYTNGAGIVLAVFWVVLLTNAHNFIDGLDGLLCSCGAVEGLMLGACFFLAGEGESGILALLLAGACFGFRAYNRYPARIFAGDCGSESLGFAFAMLSLPLFVGEMTFSLLTPLFIFAFPIIDLFSTVLRRVFHGYSPFRADRAHLHHRLFAAGIPHAECTDILTSLSAIAGLVGVLLSRPSLWLIAAIACPLAAWYLVHLFHYVQPKRI